MNKETPTLDNVLGRRIRVCKGESTSTIAVVVAVHSAKWTRIIYWRCPGSGMHSGRNLEDIEFVPNDVPLSDFRPDSEKGDFWTVTIEDDKGSYKLVFPVGS